MIRPFHLALPTKDLKSTIHYYTTYLGCTLGRSDTTWVDFNCYGHQVVFHECPTIDIAQATNPVDSKAVRVPHFGIVLTLPEWQKLADRLTSYNQQFIIDPYTRFKGTPGEQSTMFFEDNNGYALEMKAFEDDRLLFEPFTET